MAIKGRSAFPKAPPLLEPYLTGQSSEGDSIHFSEDIHQTKIYLNTGLVVISVKETLHNI